MPHNKAKCLLCPHYCILSEGEVGFCRARINRKGKIVLKDYGYISSLTVEPIEKKPFKHFLSGTKTLSVGGFGCNLRCPHCENHIISQSESHIDCRHSDHFTPSDIIELAIEKHCDSVCMTYNEPTIAFEYLMKIGNLCVNNNLKFIINTNAYINHRPWNEICSITDAMNIDIKGTNSIFKEATGCCYTNIYYKILSAITSNTHIEISILIYAGVDMREYLYCFCEKMKELGLDVPCHLLRITPAYKTLDVDMTSKEEINIAKNILTKYFTNIYV